MTEQSKARATAARVTTAPVESAQPTDSPVTDTPRQNGESDKDYAWRLVREFAWRTYPNDAREVLTADVAPWTHCRQRACRAPIWWGWTRANGRRCPFDITPDGQRTATSHWRTCRDRPRPKS